MNDMFEYNIYISWKWHKSKLTCFLRAWYSNLKKALVISKLERTESANIYKMSAKIKMRETVLIVNHIAKGKLHNCYRSIRYVYLYT